MMLPSCVFSLVPQLDPTAGLHTRISQVNTNFKGIQLLKHLNYFVSMESGTHSAIA